VSAVAVKVSSDKQTLILKGEPVPPRLTAGGAGASRSETGVQLQRVTMLLVNAVAVPAQSLVPYSSTSRPLSGGAVEYSRTQNLSGDRPRSQFIDTYA